MSIFGNAGQKGFSVKKVNVTVVLRVERDPNDTSIKLNQTLRLNRIQADIKIRMFTRLHGSLTA